MKIIVDYLRSAGYTAEFLLAHFSLPRLHHLFYPLGRQGERFARLYRGPGTPLFLARVFIGGYSEPKEAFLSQMPEAVFDALRENGLLEQAGTEWQAPGLLFPYGGLFINADRAFRGQERMPDDRNYVAGGVDPTSVAFHEGIAATPCRTLLEMGTGSGVGAILASRYAERVWAVDINPRSIAYARRNCALNGADRVTVMESDLYSALGDLRFERILANLPFVPSTESTAVFAAGGDDGERILAGFLEGVAERLEPGGRVYALAMGADREDDPFQARIRRYLGAGGEECDVALFIRKTMTPMEFAFDQVLLKNSDSAALYRWIGFFETFRVQQMVLGHLIVQRRREARPVFTVRRTLSANASVADMDRLADWETRCLSDNFVPPLLATKPRTTGHWEALSKHQLRGGQMTTLSYSILASHPFVETIECAPWVVSMASKANGELTASQLLGMVQQQTGQSGEALLRVFAQLVGAGILEI